MAATFIKQCHQTGVVLIEALVSILIFSVGVLSIIGLLTASIIASRDSTNRAAAGLLANQVIGQMWADDRTPAQLLAKYGTGGNGYVAWASGVAAQLPGVATYPPTIAVAPASTVTIPPSTLVTVTISWKPPDAAASAQPHRYTAVTQIN